MMILLRLLLLLLLLVVVLLLLLLMLVLLLLLLLLASKYAILETRMSPWRTRKGSTRNVEPLKRVRGPIGFAGTPPERPHSPTGWHPAICTMPLPGFAVEIRVGVRSG